MPPGGIRTHNQSNWPPLAIRFVHSVLRVKCQSVSRRQSTQVTERENVTVSCEETADSSLLVVRTARFIAKVVFI